MTCVACGQRSDGDVCETCWSHYNQTPLCDPWPDNDHDHEWAETDDCTTCGGGGRIYWNDSPINDPACTEDAECPDCAGDREEAPA